MNHPDINYLYRATRRLSLSAICLSTAGMFAITFIYYGWMLTEDIYDALVPEVEVALEETIDLYPHIQPIVVAAKRRPVLNENN